MKNELTELLNFLTPEETAELDRLLEQGTSTEPNAIWTPQKGPQTEALLTEAFETLYGGQAGGGKTHLLLGLATTKHHRSIILRRIYKDLEGAEGLIEKSHEILGGIASWNGQRHLWKNIPGDRMLEFAGCEDEKAKYRFRGRAHDLKAFDEVTEFTETMYRFIIGWTRTTVPDQRCRVIATCNPPTGDEGEWIVARWAPWLDESHSNPAAPGELRWFAVIDGEDTEVVGPKPFKHDGEIITPRSRTFIPASLEDNKFLSETDYLSTLQTLPEPLRSQLIYGDFDLSFEDDPWQVIPASWVEAAQERWKYTARPEMPMSALGVDVSRGGQDQTILSPRYGHWFDQQIEYLGKDIKDGPACAAVVIDHLKDQATANVDEIGAGWSVVDSLSATDGVKVLKLNASKKSKGRDRSGKLKFFNKRAEWYWRFREALDPDHGIDMCLPPSRQLKADLCSAKWRLTTSGIQIEDKLAIKKRLGRSPDNGDSAIYAYAEVGLSGVTEKSFAVGAIMVSADMPWDYGPGD